MDSAKSGGGGRRRAELRKNHQQYGRLKAGIWKKAKELSILCDVKLCVILVSPDGKTETWPENAEEVKALLDEPAKRGGARDRDKARMGRRDDSAAAASSGVVKRHKTSSTEPVLRDDEKYNRESEIVLGSEGSLGIHPQSQESIDLAAHQWHGIKGTLGNIAEVHESIDLAAAAYQWEEEVGSLGISEYQETIDPTTTNLWNGDNGIKGSLGITHEVQERNDLAATTYQGNGIKDSFGITAEVLLQESNNGIAAVHQWKEGSLGISEYQEINGLAAAYEWNVLKGSLGISNYQEGNNPTECQWNGNEGKLGIHDYQETSHHLLEAAPYQFIGVLK